MTRRQFFGAAIAGAAASAATAIARPPESPIIPPAPNRTPKRQPDRFYSKGAGYIRMESVVKDVVWYIGDDGQLYAKLTRGGKRGDDDRDCVRPCVRLPPPTRSW